MRDAGVVFVGRKAETERARARRLKLAVATGGGLELRWQRTLFVGEGVHVPWDLLAAGFHFVERWDAAAPLWRYGVLAKDVGTAAERKRTEKVCKDLRLVLFEAGLLFVRASADGQALLAAWAEERRHGKDERLAFLRALHRVKPMFCALPRSWLAEVRDNRPATRGHTGKAIPLVRLEVEPGRFVKVRPGDEERVLKQFQEMRRGRKRKRGGKR